MSLLDMAEQDLGSILESTDEFGISILITSPANETATVIGQYNDVAILNDVATGVQVQDGVPSVAIRLSTLKALVTNGTFSGLPGKSWRFSGSMHGIAFDKFCSVAQPDIQLGMIVFLLSE